MKIMKLHLIIFVTTVLMAPASNAAVLIIDPFSEGDFSLNSNGTRTNETRIAETIVNIRRVEGLGLGQWTATMVPSDGFIGYEALEIIPAGRPYALFVSYFRSGGSFNLTGFDSFRLDFGEVSGNAMLAISVNSSDTNSLVEVPLTASGVVEYPFANMAASSLNSQSHITIRITPDSTPFSLRLNEVALVPEPNALVLAMLGVFAVIRRRR